MIVVSPLKYDSFIDESIIKKMPLIYQSIEGIKIEYGEYKINKNEAKSGYIKKYRTNTMQHFSFYKNISKMHGK